MWSSSELTLLEIKYSRMDQVNLWRPLKNWPFINKKNNSIYTVNMCSSFMKVFCRDANYIVRCTISLKSLKRNLSKPIN